MISIEQTLAESINLIKSTQTSFELEQIKPKILGKQGVISELMQQLKHIPASQKKEFGAKVNQIKLQCEEVFNQHKVFLHEQEISKQIVDETIDVSLPARGKALGGLHPVTITLNRMCEIFKSLGFIMADGPEIETDYYNFQALNIPDNHPARAMQDTFYTLSGRVLRTHTSPIQIRFAEKNAPPIRLIAPGRVFRVDMDATHSPMFHQMELLWIEKGISFANLKAVVIEFLQLFFENPALKVRFRTSFFPFTEPSAEVDIYFEASNSWLEVGGCGMVHPKVLEYMKIDSLKYSGFAFGFGIDRLTMLKYNITDLRLMFENDLDFLTQFKGER